MNNKLISQPDLLLLIVEWSKPFIEKYLNLNGYLTTDLHRNHFHWFLPDLDCHGNVNYKGGANLCDIDDHWEIYSGCDDEEHVNIRIYPNNIEFDENSKFMSYTKEEMYDLYMFLKARIFGMIEKEWDLGDFWSKIQKNESYFNDKYRFATLRRTNESEDEDDPNYFFEEVRFIYDKESDDKITMFVRKNQNAFWSYLYEDRSKCSVPYETAKDLIKSISDEYIREMATDFLDAVIFTI